MKLRAGALFVAVTISFVIAVLVSLLIMLAFYFKIQNKESLVQKKLDRNANSALNILMWDSESKEEIRMLDLYGEESDSVMITRKNWGIFEVASVKAFSGKYSLVKTAQYGYVPVEELSPALYLTDLNRPVNICGKTKITGTCYLPEAGMKIEYIDGRGFSGTKPKETAQKKSNQRLPPLDKNMLKRVTSFLDQSSFAGGLYKEIDLSGIEDSLYNSFLDTTLLIRTNGQDLKGKYLGGNIILYSNKLIMIEDNTMLDGILVFASGIKIGKGFVGTLQAFALDSIIVEENCKLNYPSALGLLKKDYKTQQPFIKLMKKTEMSGVIFTNIVETITDKRETKIILEKETLLKGQLYAEGFADIGGEVRGSVWCNKFYWKSPKGGEYDNYMVDAVIDRTKLSSYFVGSGLIPSGKKKKIVKWLE